MELDVALSQIGEIQRQMARTRTFRGYRAATTLLTGVGAIAAALWQGRMMPDPGRNVIGFVNLWVGVAIASVAVVAIEIFVRYRRSESSLERELTILAVEQFVPSIVAGALLTIVLCECAASVLWMLPGLWAIFFALGLFASRRLLPVGIIFPAAFYLLMGFADLAMGHEGIKYSAWMMGLTFGVGQAALAAVLHWQLERRHES